jgi:hypothetical protein
MIEVPENDCGQPHRAKLVGLLLEAFRNETIRACGLQHVARLAAVARDAAFQPKLLERHEELVVRQHHGE